MRHFYPEDVKPPRYTVIESASHDVPDEPVSYFVLDTSTDDVLDGWSFDRAEVETLAATLNAQET